MIIGIGSDSSGYWMHLMEYIHKMGDMQVFLWSKEELSKEMMRNVEVEVLFLQKELFSEMDIDIPYIYFTDRKDEKNSVYRFQPVDLVYQDMLRLAREAGEVGEHKKQRIFGVYSPLGRSGKTSYALAYAKEHSFFYIGMEEYGIKGKDSSAEELLYHIKNRNPEITKRMHSLVDKKDGVELIGSPVLMSDLIQLRREDFCWFLEQIRKDEQMPSVIIDFGTCAVNDLEILDYFDRVFVPVLKGETEKRKVKQFMELLFEVNGDMSDRIEQIIVPNASWKDGDFLNGVVYVDGLEF